jgi:hypothetical protein
MEKNPDKSQTTKTALDTLAKQFLLVDLTDYIAQGLDNNNFSIVCCFIAKRSKLKCRQILKIQIVKTKKTFITEYQAKYCYWKVIQKTKIHQSHIHTQTYCPKKQTLGIVVKIVTVIESTVTQER